MANSKPKDKCFIIMPISTPKEVQDAYKGDPDHFTHVLEHLFTPALNNAGFDVIPPKSTGSDIIQAEIINQLSKAGLVLCDMSILNPNVFFEFGIRTALDKPVALVVDDKTQKIPFDTSIINFHRYDSSLDVWSLEEEINKLAEHACKAYDKSTGRNSLWKYFGVAQTGEFKPEASSIDDKIDLLMREVATLKRQPEPQTVWDTTYDNVKEQMWANKEKYKTLQEIKDSILDLKRKEEEMLINTNKKI